jgi:hypothetical protein
MFRLQSVFKNRVIKMTIDNQLAASYHKVTHVIFDLDGLLLGELIIKNNFMKKKHQQKNLSTNRVWFLTKKAHDSEKIICYQHANDLCEKILTRLINNNQSRSLSLKHRSKLRKRERKKSHHIFISWKCGKVNNKLVVNSIKVLSFFLFSQTHKLTSIILQSFMCSMFLLHSFRDDS